MSSLSSSIEFGSSSSTVTTISMTTDIDTARINKNKNDCENIDKNNFRILALYEFVSVDERTTCTGTLKELQTKLQEMGKQNDVRGILLLAPEGINGTICYPNPNAGGNSSNTTNDKNTTNNNDPVLEYLRSIFFNLKTNISEAKKNVFGRFKVKIKSEIVTARCSFDCCPVTTTTNSNDHDDDSKQNDSYYKLDPVMGGVGTYVLPGPDWHELLLDPHCLVIDTRNDYEVRIGTFQNAVHPNTKTFEQFFPWMKQKLISIHAESYNSDNQNTTNNITTTEGGQKQQQQQQQQQQTEATLSSTTFNTKPEKINKIAMFCTGGIRCEKATCYCIQSLPQKNNIPVYHLKGGILNYLQTVSPENSMFQGECYVFDERIAVTHGCAPSKKVYQKCHGCRGPLSEEDIENHRKIIGMRYNEKENDEKKDDNGDSGEGDTAPLQNCKYCHDTITPQQQERFQARQRQMELAKKKGVDHLCADIQQLKQMKREQKLRQKEKSKQKPSITFQE